MYAYKMTDILLTSGDNLRVFYKGNDVTRWWYLLKEHYFLQGYYRYYILKANSV